MSRFYGKVGYATQVETSPGVWEDEISERSYYGDIVQDGARWRNEERVHKDLVVSNVINIVADAYAMEHIFAMRYVEWLGTRWRITNVSVNRPRLELRLGEKYNGPTP